MKAAISNCGLRLSARVRQLLNSVPGNCSLCRRICRGTSLCRRCQQSLPWLQSACPRCGLTLINSSGAACGYCATRAPTVDRCVAPLHYGEPVDRLIGGFKFHARFADGRSLALLLADAARRAYADDSLPQLLLPMPLHRRRWRQRGYNQALEVARVLSVSLQLPLCYDAISRQRATAAQTSLTSIAARRRNVAGAFKVIRAERLEDIGHVAIVDDVVTTMATVNALAACLRRHGVTRVDAWCLARASRDSRTVNPVIPAPPSEQSVNNQRKM